MVTWPNWVDLVVVIIVLRACYGGFLRGVLTELLHLIGAVSVTVATVNSWKRAAEWLAPYVAVPPSLKDIVVCWGLFLILLLVGYMVISRLTELLRWERIHWLLQGIGVCLGGLRGLWWSGFFVVVLASSGLTALETSVEEHSIVGPRLVEIARVSLHQVADRFPGARSRGDTLVPPLRLKARR